MELSGLWFDGRSSRACAVRLRISSHELLIEAPDGASHTFALSGITISPRLGSTPRVLGLPEGGRIEVPDSSALDRWNGQMVSRVETVADWLERRRLAIALSALSTVLGVVVFLRVGVPFLAEVVAARIPAGVERQASNQVVTLLMRMQLSPSHLSQQRQRALTAEFGQLVAGEPRAGQMQLQMVAAPSVGPNAFTLPDGRIFLTDELVRLAHSDDELMAVLAHEAGHHVHRHAMRLALESSSVFLVAGLALGDVSGSSLAVSLPVVLLNNGFSRGHEREADAYAFDLLKRRGKSPRAFAAILGRLIKAAPAREVGGAMGYLYSHPPSPERILAAEAAARGQVPRD